MMETARVVAAAGWMLTAATCAAADDVPARSFWVFGAGGCGFRGSPGAAHLSVSYWHRPVVVPVRSSVGVVGTTRRELFLFAGINFDVEPFVDWGLTPLLSLGYYDQGEGVNLGGAFEFRSGIELFHRLSPGARVGISFHHISNAGLFDDNPGRESLFLNFGTAR